MSHGVPAARKDDPAGMVAPRPGGWLGALPDRLTRLRLALIPVLWLVSLARDPLWLGLGVTVAALTDVIDGPIARRTRTTTQAGSQLDSLADHLLTASLLIWLLWMRPEFFAREWPLLGGWLALGAVALAMGWIRFRRFGNLHLYSAKVAGAAGYLFALWLLTFGRYSPVVFRVVIGLCYLSATEHLLVVLTRKQVDEHVGSILRRG